MVVCIVGDEAILKRYYKGGLGLVRLESSDRDKTSVVLPAKDVRVQGIVVGLMRKM